MVWPHFFWQKSRALPPFPGREVQVLSQMHKDQGSEIQSNSMAFNSITLDQIVLGSNEAFGAMLVIYQVTHNGRRVYILLLCSHYQDMAYKPTRNQQGTVFSSQRI